MIERTLLIDRFQPLRLLVEGVGPFRDRFELDFTDRQDAPCNFFLLASPNGLGKTTLIRTFVGLLQLLDHDLQRSSLLAEFDEIDGFSGRAQLDIRVEMVEGTIRHAVVLSLWVGSEHAVQIVDKQELDRAQATAWCHVGFPRVGTVIPRTDKLGDTILNTFRSYTGKATPSTLFDQSIPMPTVLFFPAGRSVGRPPTRERRSIVQPDGILYRPAQVFGHDGASWENSLDNLLTWYAWLDDGRYKLIQEFTNRHLFDGTLKTLGPVNRAAMQAEISVVGGGIHRIDRLSHGERALMQLFVRIASHMAGTTLVVIDEMDLHLHPNWRTRLMRSLKSLVKDYPGLWIMVSTHLAELIDEFAFDVDEDGLTKAGHIISRDEL